MTRVLGARRGDFHRALERLFEGGSVVGLADAELLERFAAGGDELAFQALVERHGPMVLGVCRQHLRDPNDADDAFQAVFLVLVRKAGRLRRGDLLGAWLHGVARKVAVRARSLAAIRGARVGSTADAEALGVDARRPPGPGPAESLGRAEGNARLHEEVERLPWRYRAPVVACYFEGRTHEEAAELLGCPLGTVKGRLARARDLLRKRLERRGAAVSPAVLAGRLISPSLRPTVPASLVSSTVDFTLMTAESLPLSIRTLAEGVLKAMLHAQIKAVALPLTLVAAGLVAAGGTVAARQAGDEKPRPTENAATTPAADQDQDKAKDDKPAEAKEQPRPFRGMRMGPGMMGGMRGMEMGPGMMGGGMGGMRMGPGMMGRGMPGFGRPPGVPDGPGFGRPPGVPDGPGFGRPPGVPDGAGMPGMGEMPGMMGRGGFPGPSPAMARQEIARLSATVAKYDENPKTKAALEALGKPLALKATGDKATLGGVVEQVRESLTTADGAKVSVYVDPQGVEEAGAALDSAIAIDLEDAPLALSLRLALKQVGLAYCVRDGVVIISSLNGVLQELKEAEGELMVTHPDMPIGGPGFMGGSGAMMR